MLDPPPPPPPPRTICPNASTLSPIWLLKATARWSFESNSPDFSPVFCVYGLKLGNGFISATNQREVSLIKSSQIRNRSNTVGLFVPSFRPDNLRCSSFSSIKRSCSVNNSYDFLVFTSFTHFLFHFLIFDFWISFFDIWFFEWEGKLKLYILVTPM